MTQRQWAQRGAVLALLVLLLVLGYQVLVFFFVPILWAMILGYVSWPLHQRLRRLLNFRDQQAALLMVTALLLLIGVPLVLGSYFLQLEVRDLYRQLQSQASTGQLVLPEPLARIGWLADSLQPWVDRVNENPNELLNEVRTWLAGHLTLGKQVFSAISQNVAKLGLALLTLFFMYRDGPNLLAQIRLALHKLLGNQADRQLALVGQTTRAVVYGIGVTALVQGALAGLGYWVTGAPSPLILTVVTVVLAFIPFGTPLAWGGVVIYMMVQGQFGPALGLLAWCLVVVSWVDNIIRPALISGETKLPFLVVMFGVLGGLAAFGMIGIFIGPVLLAVLLGLWRDWLGGTDLDHHPDGALVADAGAHPPASRLATPAHVTPAQATAAPALDSGTASPVVLPPANPDR